MNKKSLFLVNGDPPRKKPKPGTLPKLNMPKKTTANESTAPKCVLERAHVDFIVQKKDHYESLQQFKKKFSTHFEIFVKLDVDSC